MEAENEFSFWCTWIQVRRLINRRAYTKLDKVVEYRRNYRREWYAKNKDRVSEYGKRNRAKLTAYNREWHKRNSGKKRGYNLKYEYNLSLTQFELLFILQGACCAICKCTKVLGRTRNWHVDHDHRTGRVRRILCYRCNTLLGSLGDNYSSAAELIPSILNYLKRHN